MRKIWDIARNDLRQIFLQKDIWINIIVLPLILAFVIGFANGAGQQDSGAPEAPDVIIDVIDSDGSRASASFLSNVRASNVNFVLCPMDNDDSDRCALDGAAFDAALAETRLRDQVSLAQIDIPAGFGDALASGENVTLGYRSNENTTAPSFILQGVQAAVQRLGASIVAERVGSAAAASAPGLTLDAAGQSELASAIRTQADALLAEQGTLVIETSSGATERTTPSSGGFSQSVPGMASMYVMFAVFPAAVAFMTERQQGTLQRLVTMPITRWQLLGGKLLARFLLGMLQYLIIFAFGGLVLGVNFGNDPLALLLTMIVFTLCITALTLALSTLLKTEAQASAVTLLLTLTLAPLGGAWWPLEIVPDWMQTLGHISPVAWAMDSYSSLIFFGGSLVTVLPYIGVLAAMAAACFAFGVLRFRIE
jgi:ABC-2 type transport system permease protein